MNVYDERVSLDLFPVYFWLIVSAASICGILIVEHLDKRNRR